jgi:serine/threonine protein kinase
VSALVTLTPGSIFARDFRVVKKLAQGGMGAVYVAEQISTGRTRALKLMHPGLVENPILRQKFEQEARIGARISSDHVVEVVAAGVDAETGIPWLAMELLDGEDLSTAVRRRGKFSPGEVVAIYEQLCHALAAAHKANIVHRDLKPENIYLAASRRAGGSATVKILDFGIARVVEEAKNTSTGAMGSPHWMAPEQTEKKIAVGPPADVWALGLIAFYLLTGKAFWRTSNDPDGSLHMFMRELVLDPIPAPTERAKELGVEFPPELDGWLSKCLSRDPAARFPNADATWQALTAVLGPPTAVRVSEGRLPSTSGSIQITPVDAGSAGLAHARTISIAEEEALEHPTTVPGLEPKSKSYTALLVGVPLVAILGGVAYFAATRPAEVPVPVPSASTAANPVPYCGPGMVGIAQGTITIGAEDDEPDERPPHAVTLNAFCIDETEVTVAQYGECVKTKSCPPLLTTVDWAEVKADDHSFWDGFCNGGKGERTNHPANCVTLDQATAFCKWKKGRLPTEEEWEYAARGENGNLFPWGALPPDERHTNVCGAECVLHAGMVDHGANAMHKGNDGWDGTAPVGTFPAGRSSTGVLDMAGNVSESTSSRYCPYPGNNCSSDLRTTRGGSFADDEPKEVRGSHRHKDVAWARSPLIGFRCAN